jgi:hypothetical protein
MIVIASAQTFVSPIAWASAVWIAEEIENEVTE